MEDLNARLLQARLDYRQAKKKHKEERLSFLATFSEKDRKRLLRVEKQRELGRIAKAVTGKLGNKSVFKVEYQGKECNSQKEVETALFNVNEAKYRASDDTPFMQEPLFCQVLDTGTIQQRNSKSTMERFNALPGPTHMLNSFSNT